MDEVSQRVEEFLRRCADRIDLQVSELDDGSVVLEWRSPGRRLGFVFDNISANSSWHCVSSEEHGGDRSYGNLANLSDRRLNGLIDWATGEREWDG